MSSLSSFISQKFFGDLTASNAASDRSRRHIANGYKKWTSPTAHSVVRRVARQRG
jgi:hypothetical protein